MSKEIKPFTLKKSYNLDKVSIGVHLRCRGWNTPSAKVEGEAEISSAQARELAAALIQKADDADAKVAAKAKSDENRRKYREREIAAGRLIVMKGSPF